MAAMIDQEPSHRLRPKRQAMGSSLPFQGPIVLKPYPRLVDERRRLQRVIPPFAPQISARDAAQLAVDQRKQLARRSGALGGHGSLPKP